MLIIGFAGALYTGNIAINSAAKPVTFEPAKAGWGNAMEIPEIGLILFGIIGFAILTYGLVNKKELASPTKTR